MPNKRGARIGLLSLVMLVAWSGGAVMAMSGAGPDDAQVPPGDWEQLSAGQSPWYAFYYAGDASQITVRVQVEPPTGVTFAVWTPEGIRNWRLGLEAEPIGRGSPDPNAAGNLVWSGSFNVPGTYYVAVEHAGSQPGPSYYLLEIDGDGISFEGPPPTPTPKAEPGRAQPRVAAPSNPTGKLLFQTTFGGPFYVVNVDGNGQGSPGLRRITDGVDAIWSPDGQQIAFTRWREPRGVWVINADGSGERRVFDWIEARWPSWSPDGARILFSRLTGGRREAVELCFRGFCFTLPPHTQWQLGIVDPSDGTFTEPPASQYSLAPIWSPDGERIVYADEQGLRVQSEEGDVSYLITHEPRDTGPAWSPDGGQVAFTRRQHDHWEVYVVAADGWNPRRLTDTPRQPGGSLGNSAAPAWSPDGQYIAFLTDRAGKWEIWVMRADGGGQRPMFEGTLSGLTLEYASQGERAISWTP